MMRAALEDLRLDELDVVHAGGSTFRMAPRVTAVCWRELPALLTRRARRQ
jgi:hypothetical protein